MDVYLGDWLRSIRERRGLTQRELAEAADFPVSLIRNSNRVSRDSQPTRIVGRLWLYVANVGVRDNSPGASEDALSPARAAAVRIGREGAESEPAVRPGHGRPDHRRMRRSHRAAVPCAAIADNLPTAVLSPQAAGQLRYRLDIVTAHTQLRQYSEALGTLREVYSAAPEWLAQQ